MPDNLELYDFGEMKIWPKAELKTPFEAMERYHRLQSALKRLPEYGTINGRCDHFIKNLDVLMGGLKDAMYDVMVIREAITGSKTREEADRCGKSAQENHLDNNDMLQ